MSMIGGIFVIILPIALVVFLIMAIVKSVKKDNSEESFQDVIRTMYVYTVMIIFLVMFFASTISLFNSCMTLLLPDTTQNGLSVTSTNRTIADVTTNITMLCISIPLFAYYSRIAKKDSNK